MEPLGVVRANRFSSRFLYENPKINKVDNDNCYSCWNVISLPLLVIYLIIGSYMDLRFFD